MAPKENKETEELKEVASVTGISEEDLAFYLMTHAYA